MVAARARALLAELADYTERNAIEYASVKSTSIQAKSAEDKLFEITEVITSVIVSVPLNVRVIRHPELILRPWY